MKTNSPNKLARELRHFFAEFLPKVRNMSPHTIASYRDAIVLLLRYVAAAGHTRTTEIDLADIDAGQILRFLSYLEEKRRNGASSRNVRLAAIRSFFRFIATQHPDMLDQCQRILAIPFKRTIQRTIEYLEYEEIRKILAAIDQSTAGGRRDYALLAILFNTGARVQEILNLKACDLHLSKPFQVRLFGKGRKERFCPLWPQTAQMMRNFLREHCIADSGRDHIFLNRRNEVLTRFGVRYLLKKYQESAKSKNPDLHNKRLHPHSLRHSTAMALLKSGADLTTIAQWLGHASPNTTTKYATIDLEMKREALSRVRAIRAQRRAPCRDQTVLEWLEAL